LLCPDFAIYVEDGGLGPPESIVSIPTVKGKS
jgi:hypothetical protein